MSKHAHGANSEMLLLLAWLSMLDLQKQLRQDQREQPWKYPDRESWNQPRQPVFPEELVHGQIALALGCFKRDPIYGPLFEALVAHRLTYIDFPRVAWALELAGLANPICALFFSDSSEYSEHQQKSEYSDETDAFWRVASSHPPLHDRLHRLSQTWNAGVCRGARELQSFFGWYLELAARPLQVPFFLVELLRISLRNVDWHVIAANTLGEQPSTGKEGCCSMRKQERQAGAAAEYLGEVFRVTGDEALDVGQQLPEPERTQALFLADLCRETTKALRLFLINGEAH
ncbi:hypothetical protein KDA_76630 [Dictyobacter alpinus]|uniref:Uncharacterized protein n=1 Tax=Dictyobacter alpinus TaxID=2014873 RepID=A0A402BLH0_9CHLR|nr:hypothetical protein [Dictyobacter alpinus]GCE32179.1 hypothetical protein KDA_76630 [Dictyobacter alpinus]